MSHVKVAKTIAFVTYEITPISIGWKDSLYQHLFNKVWKKRGGVQESIDVICDKFSSDYVTEIRYQFGYDFDEYEADEVGEMIDEEISVWANKNNIHL